MCSVIGCDFKQQKITIDRYAPVNMAVGDISFIRRNVCYVLRIGSSQVFAFSDRKCTMSRKRWRLDTTKALV